MIPGAYAFSQVPVSAIEPADSGATAPVQISLGDELIYLVEATPWDPNAGAEVTVRLADSEFTTRPDDDPPNVTYPAVVRTALDFESALFIGAGLGGRSSRGVGSPVFLNGDGALDPLLEYAYDGRVIRILVGARGAALADFREVLRGTASGGSWTETEAQLEFRDKMRLFDEPLQPELYAGTGGLEGNADLAGRPKVKAFGPCDNVTAVLLDPATQLYQVNAGEIRAVRMVYDKGVALTEVAANPGIGEYTVDLNAGTFTLGGAPVGTVTADVDGCKLGGVYLETAADIMRRVAESVLPPDEINQTSFNEAANRNPNPVEFYADRQIAAGEAMDALAVSIGAFWDFSRNGQLEMFIFQPAAAVADYEFDETCIVSIQRLPLAPPLWRRKMAYDPNWTQQPGDALADGVDPDRRAYLAQPYRIASAEDAAIKTARLLARDPEETRSLYHEKAGADAEAARQLDIYKQNTDYYLVEVERPQRAPFSIVKGQTVRLTYPRFGLESGRNFRIMRLREVSQSVTIQLEVWG